MLLVTHGLAVGDVVIQIVDSRLFYVEDTDGNVWRVEIHNVGAGLAIERTRNDG